MSPKFVGDVRCLVMPTNECARALYMSALDHFHRVACWRSGIYIACCVLGSQFDPTVASYLKKMVFQLIFYITFQL